MALQTIRKLSLSSFLFFLCLALLSILTPTYAQTSSYQPTSVWGMASVFIEGQSMVVHGGTFSPQSQPLGQTFALNLTTNWTTAQPVFKRLADGFSDHSFSSTLQSDGQTWFLLANATARRYFIHNDTWRDMGTSHYANPAKGMGAATDPVSGLLYIVNGYVINETIVSMQQYNPVAGSIGRLDMEPTLVGMEGFSVVWSIVRNSLLVYGGMTTAGRVTQNDLYEYLPNEGWKMLSLNKGDIPPARKNHCMVPAYNGTKMIIFGGFDQDDNAMSDIHSLDMTSMTWTKLTEGASSIARASHVCAVSNDMFVAWGGSDSTRNSLHENVTVVYNLKKNVWQETFSPLPESGESTPPSKTLHLGAIIGGVVGALCVIASVGFFVFYRHRKQQQYSKAVSRSNSTDSNGKNYGDNAMSNNNNNNNGNENGGGYPLNSIVAPQEPHQQLYQVQPFLPSDKGGYYSVTAPYYNEGIATTAKYVGAATVLGTGGVGADLNRDESVYRPNEIITPKQVQGRSPHAVTDMSSDVHELSKIRRNPQGI